MTKSAQGWENASLLRGMRGHFVKIIIEECTPTPDLAWEDRRTLRRETIAQKMVF